MANVEDMLLLLVLCSVVALWLKLSAARDRAVEEARRLCLQHGLQLLDESVGLSAIHLRRVNGLRRVERTYNFDVSMNGDDRVPGRLWMIGSRLTELSLPTVGRVTRDAFATAKSPMAADNESLGAAMDPAPVSNVVQLRPRNRLQ